jgi:F-type H+-transporting ATPase subunit gamma
MATLREIRKRISSIQSTQQITKAMKMVASARLRKAQEQIVSLRPYALEMREIISRLTSLMDKDSHIPLMDNRPVEKVLLVPVTSDRGLCGGFNSNIIRSTNKRITEYPNVEMSLYIIGRKGYDFFSRRETPVEKNRQDIFGQLKFEEAISIARDLVTLYSSGAYDRIEIVYNEFKSAVQQNVIHEQFLPFSQEEDMESDSQVDMIYEPDKQSLLNQLIPKNLNTQIWRILLESNAAEQGARMTAMESATDNADDLISRLTIFYNRSRQAAITTELTEIVSGANALTEN